MERVVLLIVGCLLAARASAGPLDDLRSPSQQPRSRWEPVLAALRPGDSKDRVLQMLQPYSVKMEGAVAGGGSRPESYRLDDLWLLRCTYGNEDGSVQSTQ